MPNYRRPKRTGATIFFTVCLADRQSDLLVRRISVLRDVVRRTRAERPFEIAAWVVLPDHLHCVWALPEGDGNFSMRWNVIKARFAYALEGGKQRPSHRKRRERGIWQRRFWEHHIRNERDLETHVHYCWYNPVKHGLARTPYDWPHSTIHRDRPEMVIDAKGDFGE